MIWLEKYSNGFVFTINNPTEADSKKLHNPPDFVSYIIFQLEVSSTGTEHFQGYLQTNKKMTVRNLGNKFNNRAHVEHEISPAEMNKHYCSKPVNGCNCDHCSKDIDKVGGPWEYGKISHLREDGKTQCNAFTQSGTKCKLLAKRDFCKAHAEFSLSEFLDTINHVKRLSKDGLPNIKIQRIVGISEHKLRQIHKIKDEDFRTMEKEQTKIE